MESDSIFVRISALVFQETDQDNLYYWRDKTGNALDLLLDDATKPTAIEIKAGATINNDYFKGLLYFKNLSKDKKFKALLYYTGSASQERSNSILVRPGVVWQNNHLKADHKRQNSFHQPLYFVYAYLISAIISFTENIQNTHRT